ncbi:hypothetical protein [Acinetobacter stercoris]|nr:hypothetical protein [Acinetobacter stercoris]
MFKKCRKTIGYTVPCSDADWNEMVEGILPNLKTLVKTVCFILACKAFYL